MMIVYLVTSQARAFQLVAPDSKDRSLRGIRCSSISSITMTLSWLPGRNGNRRQSFLMPNWPRKSRSTWPCRKKTQRWRRSLRRNFWRSQASYGNLKRKVRHSKRDLTRSCAWRKSITCHSRELSLTLIRFKNASNLSVQSSETKLGLLKMTEKSNKTNWTVPTVRFASLMMKTIV